MRLYGIDEDVKYSKCHVKTNADTFYSVTRFVICNFYTSTSRVENACK